MRARVGTSRIVGNRLLGVLVLVGLVLVGLVGCSLRRDPAGDPMPPDDTTGRLADAVVDHVDTHGVTVVPIDRTGGTVDFVRTGCRRLVAELRRRGERAYRWPVVGASIVCLEARGHGSVPMLHLRRRGEVEPFERVRAPAPRDEPTMLGRWVASDWMPAPAISGDAGVQLEGDRLVVAAHVAASAPAARVVRIPPGPTTFARLEPDGRLHYGDERGEWGAPRGGLFGGLAFVGGHLLSATSAAPGEADVLVVLRITARRDLVETSRIPVGPGIVYDLRARDLDGDGRDDLLVFLHIADGSVVGAFVGGTPT